MSAGTLDPFAFGGFEDAEIVSLFRDWCEKLRAVNQPTERDDVDDETDVIWAIEERILDAPVQGPVGLAIKAFLFAYEVNVYDEFAEERRNADPCAIHQLEPDDRNYSPRCIRGKWNETAELYLLQRAMLGLLDTAAQFAPDLKPLVTEVLNSPRTLPAEDTPAEIVAREAKP